MKKTVLILFGGESTEHEVSRISAYNVINGIDKEKYNLVVIGITKSGNWFLYEGDYEKVKDGSWESEDNKEAFISPSKSHGGIVVINKDGSISKIKIDICFPVLHGKNGEDGTLQGLLELSGINFVGGKTLSMAMCMDKVMTKIVLEKNNIPQTPYFFLRKGEDITEKLTQSNMSFPLFVKPVNAGSSIGASKASDINEFEKSVADAFLYDNKVLVEKNINCREIEVAVMGNNELRTAGPGEIISDAEFYDYDTKYITNENVGYKIPADITKEQTALIKEYAKKAYKALECRSLSRVDFFIDKDTGEIYLNEINTLPGFTNISMYPKLFLSEGVEYKELIDLLLETSIEND